MFCIEKKVFFNCNNYIVKYFFHEYNFNLYPNTDEYNNLIYDNHMQILQLSE